MPKPTYDELIEGLRFIAEHKHRRGCNAPVSVGECGCALDGYEVARGLLDGKSLERIKKDEINSRRRSRRFITG